MHDDKHEYEVNSDEWINKTQYADRVAKLVFDTLPKKKNAKKN